MVDLVLIPFAGGTSLTFDQWSFSSNINLIKIDYKGHGFRMKEPLYDTFEEMVQDVAYQIEKNKKSEAIAIFGHSMGGLVAWDTAKLLSEQGFEIRHLFISACLPPHLFNESMYQEMATDEWQHNFLTQYGRIEKDRMESRFFKKRIYPSIKNDYRLISIHKHEDIQQLGVDIACFYGIDDELMPSKGMECWEEYTANSFMMKGFPGEHFYIENSENQKRIVKEIELLISR